MLSYICILVFCFAAVRCDVPTNCSYPEVVGKWTFYIGQSNFTTGYQCPLEGKVDPVEKIHLELMFPDKVMDSDGSIGTWTMVYNQGFDVSIKGRRFFAFLQYKEIVKDVIVSICNVTFTGWVRDELNTQQPVFPVQNWGCYYGVKDQGPAQRKVHVRPSRSHFLESQRYGDKSDYVQRLNNHQLTWRAAAYPRFENMTISDMIQLAGGRKNVPNVRPSEITPEMREMVKDLPESFDWRNKEGQSYVTPIRNQGSCGSCYSFGSMGALEAGVAIATNGRIKPVFSPQYIVSCSNYSQGCDGGMGYLIAGKFAQDYGVVMESDYPYTGEQTTCENWNIGSDRIHVSDYGYVGGFYGGCNEALMGLALVKVGPIVVSFNVTQDFFHYKSGIYQRPQVPTDLSFNPFEVNNHVVVVVGYGMEDGVRYWIVKNSWGTEWGEDGYFRIRRGTDELSLESIAVWTKPFLGH
ncbi:dipeptidyl peptidase 1-like isoform X1 [Clytia hemisphaerica]|uniref:Dipeptidyl peptidase 1 n=1 Tax=Clytia hemisphaerica TaxID=252671 RepID=A0A7M5VD65_9CNID